MRHSIRLFHGESRSAIKNGTAAASDEGPIRLERARRKMAINKKLYNLFEIDCVNIDTGHATLNLRDDPHSKTVDKEEALGKSEN